MQHSKGKDGHTGLFDKGQSGPGKLQGVAQAWHEEFGDFDDKGKEDQVLYRRVEPMYAPELSSLALSVEGAGMRETNKCQAR